MNGWRALFDRKELMPTLKNRLAFARNVKKNNNKSWSEEKRAYTTNPGTRCMDQRQTIFLTTDFDGNSHRHRIEIVAVAAPCVGVYVFAYSM